MLPTTRALRPFGEEHFGDAYLGDARRTRSLMDLAERFARHPGGSLPQKCKDPNALRRCYDLMGCPAVTPERVLEPHAQRTLRLVQRHRGAVLYVPDTTELDYTGLTSLADPLGQIGNGGRRGYLGHNSLAVLPGRRAVLGLDHQDRHVRADVPADETPTQRRERASRESLLWLKAVDGVAAASRRCRRRLGLGGPPPGLLEVDIADRAADTFAFLDHEDQLGRHHVLRAQPNRRIHVGHDGGPPRLRHDHLRTLAEQGRRRRRIPERDGRPAREAVVAVAWAAVTVPPPYSHRRGSYRQVPQKVWALRVWEVSPLPAGAEAVAWFLLTGLAVTTAAPAWERADW
jgi:hypothetical protein